MSVVWVLVPTWHARKLQKDLKIAFERKTFYQWFSLWLYFWDVQLLSYIVDINVLWNSSKNPKLLTYPINSPVICPFHQLQFVPAFGLGKLTSQSNSNIIAAYHFSILDNCLSFLIQKYKCNRNELGSKTNKGKCFEGMQLDIGWLRQKE